MGGSKGRARSGRRQREEEEPWQGQKVREGKFAGREGEKLRGGLMRKQKCQTGNPGLRSHTQPWLPGLGAWSLS